MKTLASDLQVREGPAALSADAEAQVDELIRYVTGVLLEPDPTCPHAIPRDELGPLFIVVKSVIDVLDADWAARAAPRAPGSDRPTRAGRCSRVGWRA